MISRLMSNFPPAAWHDHWREIRERRSYTFESRLRAKDGRLIPVEIVDCAGLVPDAWRGRGLGNQFLGAIRKAGALIPVVDASGSTDLEGRPCKPGSHDPIEDVRFLEREITMWMAQILKRDWPRIARTAEAGVKDLVTLLEGRLSGLAIRREHILEALRLTGLNADRPTSWGEEDFLKFLDVLRRISKPMLIAANKIDLPTAEENLERLKELGYVVVPCCAEAELALRRAAEKGLIRYTPGDCNFSILEPDRLTDAQRRALNIIRERILLRFGSTGVQEAINMAFFQLLNMIVVYPVEVEILGPAPAGSQTTVGGPRPSRRTCPWRGSSSVGED